VRPSADMLLQTKWIKEHVTESALPLQKNLIDRMTSFQASSKLKRLALTVIAQQLTRGDAQLEGLKQTFQHLDTDENGFITPEQLSSVLSGDAHLIDNVILSCNTSGTQRIDITEFLAATMDKQSYDSRDILWAAFRMFDSDGDGKISKKDLAALLGKKDESSVIFPAMIAEVGMIHQCGDGLGIDFDTFRKAVTAEASAQVVPGIHSNL